jgi:hypothetical protein
MFPQAERRPLRSVPQPTRWRRCRAEQRCRDRNAENEGPSQNRGVLTKSPYPRGGFIERSATMLSVNLWTSPTPANTPRSMTTGHTKIESSVPCLGIEVENAIEIADKIYIRTLMQYPNQRTRSAAVSESTMRFRRHPLLYNRVDGHEVCPAAGGTSAVGGRSDSKPAVGRLAPCARSGSRS